jgi:hypothetical protein
LRLFLYLSSFAFNASPLFLLLLLVVILRHRAQDLLLVFLIPKKSKDVHPREPATRAINELPFRNSSNLRI